METFSLEALRKRYARKCVLSSCTTQGLIATPTINTRNVLFIFISFINYIWSAMRMKKKASDLPGRKKIIYVGQSAPKI